jgi:hypothetical protein
MDPGFHRGDDEAWIPVSAGMTEIRVDFHSKNSEPAAWSRGRSVCHDARRYHDHNTCQSMLSLFSGFQPTQTTSRPS